LADLRPIDRIGEIAAPVLLVSGNHDPHTKISEVRAMFARAREPKLLWVVDGGGHFDLEAYAPLEYRDHVLPFLIDHLAAAGQR
jgi:fermentation-respiration switch protein FrsA (DUF1100 family)